MEEYEKHVIKFDHSDGKKLTKPITWCGAEPVWGEWLFQDAQHAALSINGGSRLLPCDACCKEITKCLRRDA